MSGRRAGEGATVGAPGVTGADGRRRWIDDPTTGASFWSSAPRWRPGTAWIDVDGELVVWGAPGAFTVRLPAAAAVRFVDGVVTLGELADDLVAAADVERSAARAVIGSVAVGLADAGLLTDLDLPAAPLVREPEVDGGEVHVETTVDARGRVTETVILPDGRRRTTVEVRIDLPPDSPVDATGIPGIASVAELVPGDTCLGVKLRNGDDLPVVALRCRDGRVRRVRCQDPRVAEELRRRAGGDLAPAHEPGPVEAIVVAPYEGSGPPRVFDGRARRRGRPRTPTEVAALVEALVGEATTSFQPPTPERALALDWYAARLGGDRCVLVPASHVDGRRRRELDGWDAAVEWGAVEVLADGSVLSPAPHDRRRPLAVAALVHPDAHRSSAADRVRALVPGTPVPDELRPEALRRLAALAASLPWQGAARLVGTEVA